MREIVLDTSAYSFLQRGNLQIRQLVVEVDRIWFPPIALGELRAGYLGGKISSKNIDRLEAFLQSPRVEIANVGEKTAERYAAIYSWLSKQGTPIPSNDVWIAAVAMEKGADLVSADAHFTRVPQIQLIKLGLSL